LSGGYVLTPGEVQKWSTTAPPFVYLNTCELGEQSRLGTINQAGFASAFSSLGTRAFVGNIRRVPDRTAADFAECFYKLVAKTVSVGEALCRARRESGVRSCYAGCCVLFGDPQVEITEAYGGSRSAEIYGQVSSSIPAMWSDEELEIPPRNSYPTIARDIE